jgi:hypothetical protein
MQDSGIFDSQFLQVWKTKPDNKKTWSNMKQYYMEEYQNPKILPSTLLSIAIATVSSPTA